MRRYFILLIILFSISTSRLLLAQQHIDFPSDIFSELTKAALQGNQQEIKAEDINELPTHDVYPLLCKMLEFKKQNIRINSKSSDTLFVTSDLNISGNYSQNGPIIIYDNATLTIKNSYFTVLGDIYLYGLNSKLIIDSSTIYSPQQYFYQRTLGVTNNGKVRITNSTLDFSGLSHNVFATDSADIEMINVTKNGWATNGFWSKAKFYMDHCNQAGEYIITGNIDLKIKNTKSVLLWHHIPDTAVIDFAFPQPDSVLTYNFNNSIPGISGIEYNVEIDTCTDVMWALMPTTGSDVTLSNSTVRAIGVWFEGSDTLDVNGLVNNSSYSNFTAPLSDRNLQLNNSTVKTWSLYPMLNTHLNITGCIVGEIGAMGNSHIIAQNIYVDGSGGYYWASDNTQVVSAFTTTSSFVRSEKSGMFIYGYSSVTTGYPSALNNSIIIIIQSSVPQQPVPFDGSVAWYGYIDQPFDTYADTSVAVTGSAWIERGPTSQLMEYKSHHVYYQKYGDLNWTEIICDSLNMVYDDTLAVWNTNGLTPGQYNIRLVICDTWNNSVEGVKSVNVMPHILGISEKGENKYFNVFPNPAEDVLNIRYSGSVDYSGNIIIKDITGRTIIHYEKISLTKNSTISIPVFSLNSGTYSIQYISDNLNFTNTFTKN